MIRFLLPVVLLICSLGADAQSDPYNFSKLDIYSGLSHNQVNAILKDSTGFLWFGTISGLNRYDGYTCKVFSNQLNDSTSLFENHILNLYQLPEGKLYVDTREGPCIYDSKTEQFNANYTSYLQSKGLPPRPVTNIIKSTWFLYDSLGLYTIKGEKLPLSPNISSVKEFKGLLYIIYKNGLLQCYNPSTHTLIQTSTALQNLHKGNFAYDLFIDNDGDIWIWSFSNGVYCFQNNTLKDYSSRLNSTLVSEIVQDEKGTIWIATDHGGVNLIDKQTNTIRYLLNNPKDPRSLSQNSITALYKDDNGIIWLGTYKQGVNFLNGNIVKFPHYQHEEGSANSLQYDDVNRFVEDRHGNLWIGTNGGGLIYFNRKNNSFKQYRHDPNNKNSLSNNVIVSLCIDHEGILWIGTFYGGLNSFDGNTFTHYRHNDNDPSSLADDKVWELFEDKEQNLWVGTLGGGLDLFDRKSNRFQHYQFREGKPSPLLSNYIAAFMQDRQGNLWIGTVRGLAVFAKNSTTPVFYLHTNDPKSLSNNNVLCLLEDSKGQIYIGTRQGLNRFNPKTKNFSIITTANGLPDNTILNVLEDDNGSLWVSTSNGLCNITTAGSYITYDEMNNLQNREFNENAALKTSTGELIFGGPNGFNIIQPQQIPRQAYKPSIIFTGLQILNQAIEPGESVNDRILLPQALSQLARINLQYQENVFSIEFASLGFAHNTRDRYAYMMEGFNDDWLYTDGNHRRATFTNLDPGRYTFKVKVLKGDGVWSDVKTLQVNIQPPFWKTPLAYIIYIVTVIGLLLIIRKIALDRIHMRFEVQQQRREAERAHALEQLKTKFFTNVSHEFRTPLSLIISPLDKILANTHDEDQQKQLNLVQRNAKRLLNLVNQLLDFRKMEVQEAKLHPAIGDIIAFSKDISLSFTDIAEKKGIQYSFTANVDHLEIWFDKDKIEKILFNLLSNAFKYTHDNGSVHIHLHYKEETLAIEVSDTGIGIPPEQHEKIFERFFQTEVPDNMVNQGTGIGLAITREFVKLHEGVITVKSEPEKGTTFTVLIPAKKIYEASTRATAVTVEEGETPVPKDKSKTILVVEDNEDLRFYLKDNLKTHYQVEEAVNGKEGWEKIKHLNPDLVVSDIMMPVMDGIELARKIKSETLTAHIPVILLTAMGSEEKQIEGLHVGVNDYITKPFTFEILASRIRNLLMQQKLLQKRFQKQIEVNPAEVTVTPVDEQFLKQALDLVEQHMDNPDFSVEDLSREMHMSRVTLYRKILSLTGKAPLEFIRSIRLKRAARLLEKSGRSIAEIAYEVGFNNPKLFTKFFKEEFKVTPSQYMAGKKE